MGPFDDPNHDLQEGYLANYHADDQADLDYYEPEQEQFDEPVVNFTFPAEQRSCWVCHETFASKNKLHNHIRACLCKPVVNTNSVDTAAATKAESTAHEIKIMPSSVDSSKDVGTGTGFRGWSYSKAQLSLSPEADPGSVCLDSGAGISLIDRKFLKEHGSHIPIRTMAEPVSVRGLGTDKHTTSKYIIAVMDMKRKVLGSEELALVKIRREVHLVDDLRANMLLGNDILGPEKVTNCALISTATIHSYKVVIPIEIKARPGAPIKPPVHSRKDVIVPPRAQMAIDKGKLLIDAAGVSKSLSDRYNEMLANLRTDPSNPME